MADPRAAQIEARLSELSEELAILKVQLADTRWEGVSRALTQVNENFADVNQRLQYLERLILTGGLPGPRIQGLGDAAEGRLPAQGSG